MKKLPKIQPVESAENLRSRIDRLLREPLKNSNRLDQLSLDLSIDSDQPGSVNFPTQSINDFLDFLTDVMPHGDIYLFGGVLRDLAIFGKKGFNSDIDLVVEGDWSHFVPYIESLKAYKNKFGGYRLLVGEYPIDIWNAKETWAIRNGLVQYNGIDSLVDTTVLNWDAILMSWRTRKFIYRKRYFEDIKIGLLDIVLEENPNPLGMAVRVFRHFFLKDARKITYRAARYLANCARTYSFDELKNAELGSYGSGVITPRMYKFFEKIDISEDKNMHHEFRIVSGLIKQELQLL